MDTVPTKMRGDHAGPHEGSAPQLVVLEGPDGVGKTTLAKALVDRYGALGQSIEYFSFPGQEPGTIGELVYRLHHEPARLGIQAPTPATLQTLHVAAHLESIQTSLLGKLEAGMSVVLDRYWWSTYVYGLNSGVSKQLLQALIEVETAVWRTTLPAMLFLIDRDSPWRQNEESAQWRDLRLLYRDLAHQERNRYPVVVVQNESGVEETVNRLLSLLAQRTGRT